MSQLLFNPYRRNSIAMSQSGSGHVAPSDVNPIDATLPKATDIARITTKHFSNLPSPHMTPDKMLELAQFIQAQLTQGHITMGSSSRMGRTRSKRRRTSYKSRSAHQYPSY